MNKHRVVIIGAGMSGICVAVKLLAAGITSFRILEKESNVGGTWRDNSYPGVACDVPSHLYSFSFAPKHDWSRMYAPGPEICTYLEECIERFALQPYLQFDTKVELVEFENGEWHITTDDGEICQSDFVVSGMGGLHTPQIPDFPKRDVFRGVQFHSSHWRHDIDLQNKSVAVIGTGATAVQFVPEIAPIVKQLNVFQRTPIWVLPKKDPLYEEEKKKEFLEHPEAAQAHRHEIWQEWEEFSVEVVRDTERNRYLHDWATNAIRQSVNDPEVAEKLIPKYRYGCKRPTLSNSYYETFNRENVLLIDDPIDNFEENGIRTKSGTFHEADVIVFATGFLPFDITTEVDVRGLDGLPLAEAWQDRVAAYRSVMIPQFPNFFTLLGPNSAGLTSALEMIEAQSEFVISFIHYLEEHNLQYMHPTQPALNDWTSLIKEGMADTIMNVGCQSWWTDEDGYSHVVWPYSSVQFKEQLESVQEDHFVVGI